MKHIGITGRMGSGKSFICGIFHEEFGVPVFDSDAEAKQCYRDPGIKSEIRRTFGPESWTADGEVELKTLARKIFGNPEQLKALNRIIHPAVMERYRLWNKQQTGAPYTLFESAILYDCGLEKHFDSVIYIHCPELLSIERVRQRNGWTEKDITERLQRQLPPEENIRKADFVIEHTSRESLDVSRQRLLPQIREIHGKIIESGKQ